MQKLAKGHSASGRRRGESLSIREEYGVSYCPQDLPKKGAIFSSQRERKGKGRRSFERKKRSIGLFLVFVKKTRFWDGGGIPS